jgi:hypothetical protein
MEVRAAYALVNRLFDVRPRWLSQRWSVFRVCGGLGLGTGLATTVVLAQLRGQSVREVLLMSAGSFAVFLGSAVLRARREGAARLICFHDELAALGGAAVMLIVLGRPVLAYLDLAVLGVGVVIAIGRVGCLLVGCCHGRPAIWGLRYGDAHVDDGFPQAYAGVRLLPVQGLEALTLIGAVGVGAALALHGRPAGTVLVWFLLVQASTRFLLEFLRGDERPTWKGLSQTQWIALAILTVVAVVTTLGLGPLRPLAWAALAATVVVTLLAISRPFPELTQPSHVTDLVRVVRTAGHAPGEVVVHTTRLGIRISAQHLDSSTRHYAFSRPTDPLTTSEAIRLSRIIRLVEAASGAVLLGSVDRPAQSRAPAVHHLSLQTEPTG